MAPLGRAVLAIAVLTSCAASFSFDEAHSAAEDAIVSALASVALERSVTLSASAAISLGTESQEGSDETPVSMTKRPTTEEDAGDASTADSGAVTTVTSTRRTEAPAAATQAPTTIYIGTDAPTPISVATEAPEAVPVATQVRETTTAPVVVETQTPVVEATETPETQSPAAEETQAPAAEEMQVPVADESSSVEDLVPESGVDDASEAPTAGSTSEDAVVTVPDESTAVPLTTTGAPAAGSADTATSSPSAGVPDASDWSTSLASSSNNDTVTAASEGGSDTTREGVSPGEVHASSSTEVSSDGSSGQEDTQDTASSAPHGDKKKEKKTNGMHSSSGDSSAGSGSARTRSASGKSVSSDSGSSGDGSSGMGALLNPGGVSDVNTSSATYYSLGTGSIVAIVGVVAGIMGVLVLFATISRKKYADDEDESPLPYGYNMDIRTVTRLSPTFMHDDSFMESGYNGTALMVEMPTPHQFDGVSSTSGESADEVPSLRGNMMAVNHSMADVSLRSRVPSVASFNGDMDTGNVRVSALYSAGSSMTSGSAISGSWSSVLASDTERQPSRNTRDTSLSAWSIANLSSFGSTASGASGASGLHRMTRSSSALSADIRHTGGSDRSHGSTVLSRSRLMNQPDTNRAAATAAAVESNRSNKSTEV